MAISIKANKTLTFFILCLFFFLASPSIHAATFNVTNAVQLQVALTVSSSNGEDDTIYVAAGVHNVASTLTYQTEDGDSGHNLNIIGAGADETILDGGNALKILHITTDISVDGGDAGAGIIITGIKFQNGYNSTNDGGGISIYTYDAPISLESLDFENNSTDHNGGIYVLSAAGPVTVTGCRFLGNSAPSGDGGGAFVGSEIGDVTLRNNTLSSNTAVSAGGARIVALYGMTTLTNNTVSGNTTTNGVGGGIYLWSHRANLTNNFFRSNSAAGGGGGVAIVASDDITLSNNLYVSNIATGIGGGLAFEILGTATLINNAFGNNHSDLGGGTLGIAGNDAVLINNTFYSNSAITNSGGFVLVIQSNNGSADIYNNIIWGNVAGNNDDFAVGADGDNDGTGAMVNLYNNDFSDFDIDVADNLSQGGNIDQDPLLTSDFHLQSGSPAIDVGDNSAPSLPPTDYEGDPRIMNSIVDIGADEYPGVVTQVAIPTMSVWGLGILAGLLGLIGMRQRS